MSRKLRRVPLDFDWPLKKNWSGYENPHRKPCPANGNDCNGGQTAAAMWLDALCRLIAKMGEGAAAVQPASPSVVLEEWGGAPSEQLPQDFIDFVQTLPTYQSKVFAYQRRMAEKQPALLPLTKELLVFVQGLCPEADLTSTFNSGADYGIMETLKKIVGVDETWGKCTVCDGHGIHPDSHAAFEAWERTDPPIGEGYQLWGTTGAGEPRSPVFATLDDLCAWCETNDTTFASIKASAEEWKRMLLADTVCATEKIGDVTAVFC